MTTKSIFDVPLPLTRAALLRLMKGEHVEHRASPPGATMIEGVAKAKLHTEITEAERRAICDVLTRDVPEAYRAGYAVASWGEVLPVVGTTEWLAMIASNADRIPIKVQTGPNTWGDVYLARATPDQQREAMRTWLESGTTPTWETNTRVSPHVEDAAFKSEHMGTFVSGDENDGYEASINTAIGSKLDMLGKELGVERSVTENLGVVVSSEGDASYRERLRAAYHANKTVMRAAPPPPPLNAPPAPPVPAPPPFRAPTKTPAEEARDRIGLVKWISEQSAKVGSPWDLRSNEREFLKSCEQRLNMGEMLSDKQRQWLNDLHSTAKQKASTIAHLLPPIPKFT